MRLVPTCFVNWTCYGAVFESPPDDRRECNCAKHDEGRRAWRFYAVRTRCRTVPTRGFHIVLQIPEAAVAQRTTAAEM